MPIITRISSCAVLLYQRWFLPLKSEYGKIKNTEHFLVFNWSNFALWFQLVSDTWIMFLVSVRLHRIFSAHNRHSKLKWKINIIALNKLFCSQASLMRVQMASQAAVTHWWRQCRPFYRQGSLSIYTVHPAPVQKRWRFNGIYSGLVCRSCYCDYKNTLCAVLSLIIPVLFLCDLALITFCTFIWVFIKGHPFFTQHNRLSGVSSSSRRR